MGDFHFKVRFREVWLSKHDFFLISPCPMLKAPLGAKMLGDVGVGCTTLIKDVSFKTTCPLTEGMKAVDSNIH